MKNLDHSHARAPLNSSSGHAVLLGRGRDVPDMALPECNICRWLGGMGVKRRV